MRATIIALGLAASLFGAAGEASAQYRHGYSGGYRPYGYGGYGGFGRVPVVGGYYPAPVYTTGFAPYGYGYSPYRYGSGYSVGFGGPVSGFGYPGFGGFGSGFSFNYYRGF